MTFMNLVRFGLPERVASKVWHIPNGEQRDARVGIKLKKMGVQAGVFDLFAAMPRNGYAGWFCDMKRSQEETLTKEQLSMQALLEEEGYYCTTHFCAFAAFEDLVDYLGEEI